MPVPSPSATTLAIFCKVVDNFGDIGICWRLARQLQAEHAVNVTLWVDDLASFARICPALDSEAPRQQVRQVQVLHWRSNDGQFGSDQVADIVIEFFACDIPEGYIAAMARRLPQPVWLNLEGLSAEDWVEGCHTLPSRHPRMKLTKHFFFPGFSARTGGLLREAGLDAARRAFQADPAARAAFLRQVGVEASAGALLVSLFCYPDAPVAQLLATWEAGDAPVLCLVPHGVASNAVAAFLGAPPEPGSTATRGALTVRVIAFLSQEQYDLLLWACDLNFVRGEDSFVRAQWAARPFIWHIYPQDENLHHTKLHAFLARYQQPAVDPLALAWNGVGCEHGWDGMWRDFRGQMPAIGAHAERWQQQQAAHGDLASNLMQFAAAVAADKQENSGIMPG